MARHERFEGAIFSVRSDEVIMPDGSVAVRDFTHHPGAVAVVALDGDQVVLIHQYRHPIGAWSWELPAGLIDDADESPVRAAQRELAEEAELAAGRWNLLLNLRPSPGYSDEHVRVYLARDLTELPELTELTGERRFSRMHEEAAIRLGRIDLTVAQAMIFRSEITNGVAAAGLLAAAWARDEGWTSLRPAE